jgi:hypothetical protein
VRVFDQFSVGDYWDEVMSSGLDGQALRLKIAIETQIMASINTRFPEQSGRWKYVDIASEDTVLVPSILHGAES